MLLMEYIAGADQMPLKSLPPRQLIGPRPPPPPTPKPNFLTLGRTTTQYARVNKSGGTLLPSSIALNTVEAFLSVSSSFDLSAPQAGTIRTTRNIGINTRFQHAFLPLNRGRSDLTSMMGFPLDFSSVQLAISRGTSHLSKSAGTSFGLDNPTSQNWMQVAMVQYWIGSE